MSPVRQYGLHGVIAALTTPFSQGGAGYLPVDLNAYRAHVNLLLGQEPQGPSGIVIAGTTGEGWNVSDTDCLRLNAVVQTEAQKLKQKPYRIFGVLRDTERAALQSVGTYGDSADALLVQTPLDLSERVMANGLAAQQENVKSFYRAVADTSEVPIIIYIIPRVSHFPNNDGEQEMTADMIHKLAEHPNVYGAKLSVPDETLPRAVHRRKTKTHLLPGNDRLVSALWSMQKEQENGHRSNYAAISGASSLPVFVTALNAIHYFKDAGSGVVGRIQTRTNELLDSLLVDAIRKYNGEAGFMKAALADIMPNYPQHTSHMERPIDEADQRKAKAFSRDHHQSSKQV